MKTPYPSPIMSSKLPCQFYLLGTCSRDNGCEYSHDLTICKPGVIKENCKHYMTGYCRNGNHCLNIHDPLARDNAMLAKKEKTSVSRTVIQMHENKNIKDSHDIIDSKQSVTENNANDKKMQSQEEYHRQLQEEADSMYFYGQQPVAQSKPPTETLTADFSKLKFENTSGDIARPATNSSICKFYEKGACRFGDACRFSHPFGITPIVEDELTKFEKMASEGLECGICMEVVSKKGDGRFGLLPNCDHVFCLKCIRDWRSSDMAQKEDKKALVRRCPLCRETSFLVIPCSRIVRDQSRKDQIIKEYIVEMGKKHCTYFDYGNGRCPFGTSCFYKHMYPDGTLQDPGELRVFKNADGEWKFDGTAKLSDYFEVALRMVSR